MRLHGSTALCRFLFVFALAAACWGRHDLPPSTSVVSADVVYDSHAAGVIPPKVRKRVKADYSFEARSAGIQGTCLLQVVVDRTGRPGQITVLNPVGFGLERKAMEAVSQWRVNPAQKSGMPVSGQTTVEVAFRLQEIYFDPKLERRRIQYNLMLKDITAQGNTLTSGQERAMRDFASQGFTSAEVALGLWNLLPNNDKRNEAEGVRLIEDAAQKQHPAALYVHGQLLTRGYLVPRDMQQGIKDMQAAAVLGSIEAARELGIRYAGGKGVAQDTERARRYFRQCARAGNADCEYELGRSLQTQGSVSDSEKLQALAWLQLAAAKDQPQAKQQLAEHPVTLTAEQNKQVEALLTYLPQSDFQ